MDQRIDGALLKGIFFRPQSRTLFISLFRSNEVLDLIGVLSGHMTPFSDPHGLPAILETDDLDKLMEKASDPQFNFNLGITADFFEERASQIPLLHYSISKGATKCFKFILMNGGNPNETIFHSKVGDFKQGQYQWDSISVAAAFGQIEMMKMLEDVGLSKFGNVHVFEAAIYTHRNRLLKQLIGNIPERNLNFTDPIFSWALKSENYCGLKYLYRYNEEIGHYLSFQIESDLIFIAVEYNLINGVKILLDQKADFNIKNARQLSPLQSAFREGSYGVAYFLIQNDICTQSFQSALRAAVEHNLMDIVKLLLRKGVEAEKYRGSTLLHEAVSRNLIKMTKLLLDEGFDIDPKNRDGETPLFSAIQTNKSKLALLLIERGANVNAKNYDANTPLVIACTTGQIEIAKLLISKGAKLNLRDREKVSCKTRLVMNFMSSYRQSQSPKFF